MANNGNTGNNRNGGGGGGGSQIMANVYAAEYAAGARQYSDAMRPTQSGVIPDQGYQQNILNRDGGAAAAAMGAFISPLTGLPAEMTHNNMVPYYRGESKQNMNMDTNRTVMENFTGTGIDSYREKQEVKSFFDLKDNLGKFVNGSPIFTEQIDIMNRYIPSNKRQGETPVAKINVGPGIAAGFVATPSGGLNQANSRDYIMPKDTNELRAANKPKDTYEGRIINGLKHGTRGIAPTPKKYRPDTYYDNNLERYFKNGGNVKAAALREKYCFPENGRQTSRSHYGGASSATKHTSYKAPAVRKSTKHSYMTPVPRNAYRAAAWTPATEGAGSNYGKDSYDNVPNERLNTESRTVLHNIATSVKKMITPVQDFFRKTRNENFIGNNRPDGNFGAAMPSKPTVHDPEDVARTTLKEQNIDNVHDGFLGGNVRHTVHDPNDVARTTIKETNIHNDAPYINFKPAKPTALTVYDPEDIPRTTTKETVIDNDHMGFVSKAEHGDAGAYTTQRYTAKNTNKQFTSDYEYTGIADGDVGKGGGRGYLATRYNAKATHKQFLSNNEYSGNAGQGQTAKPSSYGDFYRAKLNPNKELIARGREPTQQGAKLNAGEDYVNLQHKKIEGDRINIREPSGTRTYQVAPQQNRCGMTIVKNTVPEDALQDRLNPALLDQFRKNPYTQSLSSAV